MNSCIVVHGWAGTLLTTLCIYTPEILAMADKQYTGERRVAGGDSHFGRTACDVVHLLKRLRRLTGRRGWASARKRPKIAAPIVGLFVLPRDDVAAVTCHSLIHTYTTLASRVLPL